MLKLYNAGASVCSIKVRLGLAEKAVEWEDVLLALPKGEQHEPEYLKLNPNGVVPTLVDDDLVVIESSVILQYVDEMSDDNVLMPVDKAARVKTQLWLLRCLDIHGAINTITFSTVNRDAILKAKTPAEIEASIARMPDPKMAAKRRDLLEHGLNSVYLTGDFFTLKRLFDDMQSALTHSQWLTGDNFAMADVAVLPYVDRLARFGMQGFWDTRAPEVNDWLASARARPSYARAMDRYISAEEGAATHSAGTRHWPAVKERWEAFLA
jgi:glutathione S-transferase